MNQQRSRRFRSAQEAKEADEKKEEFKKLLRKHDRRNVDEELGEEVIEKTWDSNVITPGTPFMDVLAVSLRYWVAYKLNTDPAWEKVVPSRFLYRFAILTLHSSKLSYPTQRFLGKENIKSWSLYGLKGLVQSMIPILAT